MFEDLAGLPNDETAELLTWLLESADENWWIGAEELQKMNGSDESDEHFVCMHFRRMLNGLRLIVSGDRDTSAQGFHDFLGPIYLTLLRQPVLGSN